MAVVATARKLVTIAWHMLKNNEPYRYAVSSTVEAKFARLRIRVTGQRSTFSAGAADLGMRNKPVGNPITTVLRLCNNNGQHAVS